MATIKMYNVEFGESILVSKRDERTHLDKGLLIDCGTRCSLKTYPTIFEPIRKDLLPLDEKKLMITHFHEDHICGLYTFLNSNPVHFNRVYLPDLFDTDHYLLDLVLLKYYLQNALKQRNSRQPFDYWTLICKFISSHTQITLLRKGNTFKAASRDWNVYWPEAVPDDLTPYIIQRIEAGLIDIIDNREEVLRQVQAILEKAHHTADCLSELVREYSREDTEEPNEPEINEEIWVEEKENIDNLINELLDLPLSQNFFKSNLKRNLLTFITGKENEYSIVCDSDLNNNKRFLFTGDVTPNVLEETIIPQLLELGYGPYFCIKAPHHGTALFYTDDLSQLSPRVILISNGVPYYSGTEITDQYIKNTESTIFCTNGTSCPKSKRGPLKKKCLFSSCPLTHFCFQGLISFNV